jgi:hypothetical protein
MQARCDECQLLCTPRRDTAGRGLCAACYEAIGIQPSDPDGRPLGTAYTERLSRQQRRNEPSTDPAPRRAGRGQASLF